MKCHFKKAIRGNTKLCKEVYFLTEFATLEVSLSLRNLSALKNTSLSTCNYLNLHW